jgi:hypothetical protein
VYRNQGGERSWIGKAVVYPVSSALAGLTAGTLLGAAGNLLPLDLRLAAGSVLAVAAVAAGAFELFGRRIRPPQLDCETPQRWMHNGPLWWAIQNGVALLSGSPALGAAIYGTYGLVRGAAAPVILLGTWRLKGDVSDWLVMHREAAQNSAAVVMVLTGVAVAIVVGF